METQHTRGAHAVLTYPVGSAVPTSDLRPDREPRLRPSPTANLVSSHPPSHTHRPLSQPVLTAAQNPESNIQKTSEQTPRPAWDLHSRELPCDSLLNSFQNSLQSLWLVSFFHIALWFMVEAIFACCSEFETSGKYKEQNQITSLRILNVVGQR